MKPAKHPWLPGVGGAFQGGEMTINCPEAAGCPLLAAVCAGGQEGQVCAGHSFRELLAQVAPRAASVVVAG